MFQFFDPQSGFQEVLSETPVSAELFRDAAAARMPQFVGLQTPASEMLKQRKIAIVATGSIGRRIAFHAARLSVQSLWLIDPDRYDHHANIATQEILAADLGCGKAENTARACKSISPGTRVSYYAGKVQDLDPAAMANADVIFLATDNLAAEVDVAFISRLLGIPVVQAAVHGETLVAQVRFTTNRHSTGPCPICAYGAEDYRQLNRSSVFRCTGADERPGSDERVLILPTMSTSFLCSLAASFAMVQWTRHTLELGQPVADSLLQYCGYTHRLTQSAVVRTSRCRNIHLILERVPLPKFMGECSPCELLHFAGIENHAYDKSALTLDSFRYIQQAVCRCATHQVGRFVRGGESCGPCETCGGMLNAQPYYTSRPTPLSDLQSQLDHPLKTLGAAEAKWAVIQCGERAVLLLARDSDVRTPNSHQTSTLIKQGKDYATQST